MNSGMIWDLWQVIGGIRAVIIDAAVIVVVVIVNSCNSFCDSLIFGDQPIG